MPGLFVSRPARPDFVSVLRDVTRGAPAREIKSGKGFAEALESETGFPFLQLYGASAPPPSPRGFYLLNCPHFSLRSWTSNRAECLA